VAAAVLGLWVASLQRGAAVPSSASADGEAALQAMIGVLKLAAAAQQQQQAQQLDALRVVEALLRQSWVGQSQRRVGGQSSHALSRGRSWDQAPSFARTGSKLGCDAQPSVAVELSAEARGGTLLVAVKLVQQVVRKSGFLASVRTRRPLAPLGVGYRVASLL
jgi:hypothetical protein